MPWLFLQTLCFAGGVGLFATLLAIAPAWVVRARGWRAVPLMMVPLFSPPYLAYSGWQLLRSPGTLLGDWIERQTVNSDFVALTFGKGLAVFGLSLWAWPVALLLLIPSFRSVDEDTLEALRVDGASIWQRGRQVLRMARSGLLLAWAAVTLLMLGSAVPFHLAQVPTYAVQVWAVLAEQPGKLSVWIFASPVVGICVLAAWGMARWRPGFHPAQSEGGNHRARAGWSLWAAGAVWILAVAAPLFLFAGYLHSWGSVDRFVRESTQALVQSGVVSTCIALGTTVLLMLSWWAFSSRHSSAIGGRVSLGLFFLGMVLPGILVGSAVLRLVTDVSRTLPAFVDMQDGLAALVWGHLDRFGALGVLVGGAIAWNEPPNIVEMRALDGCGPWRGVWEFALRPGAGLIAAVAVASGLMSLYEIESTILLIPPGPGSLSHTILAFLHFARDEQLCAAGVSVMGSGFVLALVAALVARTSLPGMR